MLNVIVSIAILAQTLLPATMCPPCSAGGKARCGVTKPSLANTKIAKAEQSKPCRKACKTRCGKHAPRRTTPQVVASKQLAASKHVGASSSSCGVAATRCSCDCSQKLPVPKQPATPAEAPAGSHNEKNETAPLHAGAVCIAADVCVRTVFRDHHDPPPQLSHNHRQAELAVWLN